MKHTDSSILEAKESIGILKEPQSKYNRTFFLFWRYLAARRINETIKKPSYRSAVTYYLSVNGRHIEFNLFKEPKIEILFPIPYIFL